MIIGAGTHDNETMEGWWADSAAERDRDYIREYLGLKEVQDISWTMLREAFKSISRTSIVMMQVIQATLSLMSSGALPSHL